MHRRLALVAAVLIASATLATCAVVSSVFTGHLDIEQAELQARIAPRFPDVPAAYRIRAIARYQALQLWDAGPLFPQEAFETLGRANVYQRAYEPQTLDSWAEQERWCRAGARVPAAPPTATAER